MQSGECLKRKNNIPILDENKAHGRILAIRVSQFGGMIMRKVALILGIIFLILTFVGGGYVLINHGQVNAGYAVIPLIWTMICFGYYRKKKE